MNSLKSRKQLLIAESELNRTHLEQDWCAITTGVRTLTDRAKSTSSFAAAAAMLVTGFATWRRVKSEHADGKLSWLQKIFKGAGLISTVWLAFRARGQDQKDD